MKYKSFRLFFVFTFSLIFSSFAWGQAEVIVVAKNGGDFTNPVDAINSITDASRTNPYIISISPGVYHLGSKRLNMKNHVSLIGSGKKVTFIVSEVDSEEFTPGDEPSVINGADASEIRHLTVVNRYSGTSMQLTMAAHHH